MSRPSLHTLLRAQGFCPVISAATKIILSLEFFTGGFPGDCGLATPSCLNLAHLPPKPGIPGHSYWVSGGLLPLPPFVVLSMNTWYYSPCVGGAWRHTAYVSWRCSQYQGDLKSEKCRHEVLESKTGSIADLGFQLLSPEIHCSYTGLPPTGCSQAVTRSSIGPLLQDVGLYSQAASPQKLPVCLHNTYDSTPGQGSSHPLLSFLEMRAS